MKLAAITRVLNEADIIESFARHTAAYVSHHVFMDNGSSDGTVDILRELSREGLSISVYKNAAVTYNGSDSLTALYEIADLETSPDWIVCLDADEFIDDRLMPNGLVQFLTESSKDGLDCMKIPMVNYIATSLDNSGEAIAPLRITRRRPPSEVCKIIIRAGLTNEGLRIQNGSHSASLRSRALRESVEDRIQLAHYSERSPYQYIMKFVRGWSKVLATGRSELEKNTSFHYKHPFEILRDTPWNLLYNKEFMNFKDEKENLVEDPIEYRGCALRYNFGTDDPMRAVRNLMGLLNDLAVSHGRLMDEFPPVCSAVREWEKKIEKLF